MRSGLQVRGPQFDYCVDRPDGRGGTNDFHHPERLLPDTDDQESTG